MPTFADYIRNIPDFPSAGIQFKDITPLLKMPDMLAMAITELAAPFMQSNLTMVVGIEARGFIFGSLVARELGVGFVPLRKPGKLPGPVASVSYALEYGHSTLEMHRDALSSSDRVLLVDDVIATGGTALASCQLLEQFGVQVVACAFLIALDALPGQHNLRAYQLHTLLHY